MNMFTPKKEKQFSTNTRRFTMNMFTPKKEKQFSTNMKKDSLWIRLYPKENEKQFSTNTRRFTMNMTPKENKNSLDYKKENNTRIHYEYVYPKMKERKTVWFEIMKKEDSQSDYDYKDEKWKKEKQFSRLTLGDDTLMNM